MPLHPSADFFALRDNYRSVPELIAFSNVFAAARLRAQTGDIDEIEFSEQAESLRVPPSRAREMGEPGRHGCALQARGARRRAWRTLA